MIFIIAICLLSIIVGNVVSYHNYFKTFQNIYRKSKQFQLNANSDNSIIDLSTEIRNGSPITWKADVKSSVKVKEIRRTCEAYMSLPGKFNIIRKIIII